MEEDMIEKRRYTLFTSILVFSLFSLLSFAATINVPGNQPTIQSGIDNAQDGDTVLVNDGIYRGEGNVNIDFKGKNITLKSLNGMDATIIDCQAKINTRGFVFQSNETENAVLDGFTIKNGVHQLGGGIYCNFASPTIKNCIITNNRATSTVRDVGGGGGIFCKYSSTKIINCQIKNNSADSIRGAGILFTDKILLTETEFITFESSEVIDCNISENNGIGVFVYRAAPTLIDCVVLKNGGRGILCDFISRGVRVEACRIEENNGGVECGRNSHIIINNSIIKQNSATIGGGVLCSPSSEINVKGCLIVENTAYRDGGGIYIDSRQGSALIENCTIANNFAERKGGGIYCFSHTIFTLTDSIVWGNNSGDTHSQLFTAGAYIKIKRCNIEEGLEGIGQEVKEDRFIYEDNIDEDPMFVDAEKGDYTLNSNSPSVAIGAYPLSVYPSGKIILRWGELKLK